MTLEFDRKSIRKEKTQTRLFDLLEPTGREKAKELVVKKVDASLIRQFVATYHYSHIMPDNSFECFAGYYGDKLAGVVVFGNGANNATFTALIPDIGLKNCRELTRLWSPDGMPKNTESRLIKESVKLLPKEVCMVVSFADPSQNHQGTIYQATNFYYCGMSKANKMLTNGKEKFHIRTIGSYKRRHPELRGFTNQEVMAKYGWTHVESSGKHRYVLFRGDKWLKNLLYNQIKERIMEYPINHETNKEQSTHEKK
jgi:hypothetical protein|tara:strand:- start:1861 stop:2625 length:765 start_codon:yes stop_codon:yes gene_type:complete